MDCRTYLASIVFITAAEQICFVASMVQRLAVANVRASFAQGHCPCAEHFDESLRVMGTFNEDLFEDLSRATEKLKGLGRVIGAC
jgi:hypothetical protein